MSDAAFLAGLARVPNPLRVVRRLDGDDLADLAVEDLLHGLAARAVITPAEAVDQREVLGLGVLAGLEELAQARPVDGHRLLDEGVDPLFDGIGQVNRPEVRGRRQENQVDLVDDVLVGVEARVLAILGNIDSRANLRALEDREMLVEPILEGVGHGDKPGIGVGRERLLRRAGASAAAADQPDLDRAAAGGMDQRNRQTCRKARGRRRDRRPFEKIATRGSKSVCSGHRVGLHRLGVVVHGKISSGMGRHGQFPGRQFLAPSSIATNAVAFQRTTGD